MNTIILSNPRAAWLIMLSASFFIGCLLALVVFWLAHRRIVAKSIDRHTDNALSIRNKQITVLQAEVIQLNSRIYYLKARMEKITIFLSKAVEAVGVVE